MHRGTRSNFKPMSNNLQVVTPSATRSLDLAVASMEDSLKQVKVETDRGEIPVEFALEFAAAIDVVRTMRDGRSHNPS